MHSAVWVVFAFLVCIDCKNSKYVVSLSNECPVELFMAAFGPSTVYSSTGLSLKSTSLIRLGEWSLLPGHSLSIKIPHDWLSTEAGGHGHHRLTDGPRFWARTGCYNDKSVKLLAFLLTE
jgi:hypothetical protein